MDFIMNGQGSGQVADKLIECNGDIGVLRPWIGEDLKQYCTLMRNGKEVIVPMVGNVTTTMRKDDWLAIDDTVIAAAKPRLKAVADLIGAGLTFGMNGMAFSSLQTETVSDINEADVSMDGMREGRNDRPEFDTTSIPLPIIHKDFSYSARNLLISRNGGSPLDITSAALSSRRVAEEAEKMLIGNSTKADQYKYAGGTIYGYTDFPSRLTKTFTSPLAGGWTGSDLVNEVLAATQQLRDAFAYGPYMLYTGTSWQQYLGNDFKAASDKTLRDRVLAIDEISDIRPLDYLSGFDLIFVQLTSDVVREIMGLSITTVQWDTLGGMKKNFKVMAIMVPQLRADFNGNTGILHGSV
jgi:hypothetical protein